MKSHSNLNINLGTIDEDGTYNSEEDDDFVIDDLADDVSQLSMDEYSFDTVTTAFRSEAHKIKCRAAKSGEKALRKTIEKISGNTKIGLPYLLDLWRDCCSHARISVQVLMLSGRDAYKKTFVRISTDGKELILTLPMSPYMSRSDFAFNTFLLAEQHNISDTEKHYLKILLKHHPKCAARMVAVSKVKGRSYADGFFYEQRIQLPRKVQHDFATQKSGDDLFTGKKFIEYPDGSVFLHVELVAEVKDNYIPEERMLDPKYMKSVPKTSTATPMETETTTDPSTSTRVLPEDKKEDDEPTPANKRFRAAGKADSKPKVRVETVNEDSDDDDDEEMSSQCTGPNANAAAAAAAAAATADAEAAAEAARSKAGKVLEEVEQYQAKTSLEKAVEKGTAEAAAGNI